MRPNGIYIKDSIRALIVDIAQFTETKSGRLKPVGEPAARSPNAAEEAREGQWYFGWNQKDRPEFLCRKISMAGGNTMKRIEPKEIEIDVATKVWSVTEYAKRHGLNETEEYRLKQMFGPFATACELQHNVKRQPRWR